jgi:uncharacterized membrane protein YhaH (DUF805 family)
MIATILVAIIAIITLNILLPDSYFSFAETPIDSIFALALACPALTVAIRRFHDIGKSAWYILIMLPIAAVAFGIGAIANGILGDLTGIIVGLIILAGLILNIYWLTKKSDPHENKYGPNPLEVST